MSSAKWRPSCHGLNVLNNVTQKDTSQVQGRRAVISKQFEIC